MDTPVKTPTSLVETTKPKEPGGIRITLSVCDCYSHDRLTLITAEANHVTSILGITLHDLECFAITAMLTHKPQVVACYKQRDVAEAKLAQLDTVTPFIARACHSFSLCDM